MPFTPEEFQKRFLPRPIKPIPTPKSNLLWAYQTAKEVTRHPGIVDPELYRQAVGYTKQGLRLEKTLGEAGAALQLKEEGIQFAGWSRNIRRNLSLFPEKSGEQFITRWNRLALTERLTKAVGKGPFDPRQPLSSFYGSIAARARHFGITGELASKLGPSAPEMLTERLFPPTLGQQVSRGIKAAQKAALGFEESILSKAGLRGLSTVPLGTKMAGGFAVTAMGLYLTKPLSLFSGKDDEYNTIEGLPHGGQAERLRRIHTDFGSGYQGSDTSETAKIFNQLKVGLEKYGVEAGTGHKRIFIPKNLISEEELTGELGFVPVTIAIPESGQSSFVSYRHTSNLYHLHEHDKMWTMHEDVHAAATMSLEKLRIEKRKQGEEVSVAEYVGQLASGVPHIVTEGVPGAYYYLKGKITNVDPMIERIREEVPEQYYELLEKMRDLKGETESVGSRFFGEVGRFFDKGLSSVNELLDNSFSGKDDAYNTIEGLSHKGMAGRTRRENTDFGSGWRGIFGRVKSFFKVRETLALEKRFLKFTPAEIKASFGTGATEFSAAQVSGPGTRFVEQRLQRIADNTRLERMLLPAAPHKQAQMFGKGPKEFSGEQIRGGLADRWAKDKLARISPGASTVEAEGLWETVARQRGESSSLIEILESHAAEKRVMDRMERAIYKESDNHTRILREAAARRKAAQQELHKSGVAQAHSYSLNPGKGHAKMKKILYDPNKTAG